MSFALPSMISSMTCCASPYEAGPHSLPVLKLLFNHALPLLYDLLVSPSGRSSIRIAQVKNPSRQTQTLSGTGDNSRGATLIHGLTRALSEIPAYLRQLTYAYTSQNTWQLPFPAPLNGPFNRLHFDPAQLPGLSVRASLFLSPLQRFGYMDFLHNITTAHPVALFLPLTRPSPYGKVVIREKGNFL